MRVFIYWNLHRACWSVKALEGAHRGRVVAHASDWQVAGAAFKVSEAGRQRVLREQRKNVHAGVGGHLVAITRLGVSSPALSSLPNVPSFPGANYPGYAVQSVTYNPYRAATFTTLQEPRTPVLRASQAWACGRAVQAFEVAA